VTTIGIVGAGEMGAALAQAAALAGYEVVLANRRGPDSLAELVAKLGPAVRAATARDAAAAGELVILSFPYRPLNDLPVAELAGKVVLDTNNYMAWRDGDYPAVTSGRRTVHELRQRQLPESKVAKAFTHVQGPRLLQLARPAGDPDRRALAVSSDFPEAVAAVTQLYDRLGYDAVDNSPLSESWRSGPGTPVWRHHVLGQSRDQLVANLALATR
jgi:8-hydroxy-5-deazaflavin:NADPH oxidoreductase